MFATAVAFFGKGIIAIGVYEEVMVPAGKAAAMALGF